MIGKANGKDHGPPLTLEKWLVRDDIPELDLLLGCLLSATSRMLIVGPTGLGKTLFGIALAFAVASGNSFLKWRSRRKARVLYVDGEMSRREMKRRLRDAVRREGTKPEGLGILSKEDHEDMPPLNTAAGQKWLDTFIAAHGPFDLIIFDNIQALLVGDMREEEQWSKICLMCARSRGDRSAKSGFITPATTKPSRTAPRPASGKWTLLA